MNKLSDEQENPIDRLLLIFTSKCLPYFNRLKMTPNHLTTIGFLLGILSIYLVYNDHIWLAILPLILRYVFDCADGQYARHYNMTSNFGDLYDHITDVVFAVGIIMLVLIKTTRPKNQILGSLLVMILMHVLAMIHFGCQESIYKTNKPSLSMRFVKPLCKNPEKLIKYTRFFGSGTQYVVFIFWIIFMLT